MSDYDMTFDKKIVDADFFDTVFDAEEDDQLMDLVMKEDADAFNTDERDTDGIEDGLGKIGAGDGLGSDLGPGKDEIKTTDDSSDQEILAKTDNNLKDDDQLNVSDTTGEKVKDGGMVNTNDVHASGTDELVGNDPAACERHIDDATQKIANSVDGFDEAANKLLEDAETELGAAPVDPEPVAPAAVPPVAPTPDTQPAAEVPAAPAEAPVPAPAEPVAPDAEVPAPVAAGSDAGVPSDIDLLDTDPVDEGPVEEGCKDEECKEEEVEKEASVDDLDKEEEDEEEDVEEAAGPVDTDDVKDKVNMSGIEDKSGKIGTGDGLGNDLGPDHDTKGDKPTADSSDEEITPKDSIELKNDQLNVADDASGKVTDGGMVKDFANAGEDGKNASDSFKEASVEDLENIPEDEEEDKLLDAVESNKDKSEYTVDELNADDDDDILDMLDAE